MSATTKPRDRRGPNVHAFLDASTAHLTSGDLAILTGWGRLEPEDAPGCAPFRTISHAYGFFVHVPLDDTRVEMEAAARAGGMSDAFFALQDYARARKCWWINLDRDADTVPGMPADEA